MSKELATIETTMQALTFTSDEINFIKEKYAPDATDLEFKEFVALCQIHNASPLKKEVYFIKYGGKASIVFSYHWMLTKAMRSGVYRGLTDVEYADEDGKWFNLWTDQKKMPIACRIGVKVKDAPDPIYATIYWKERAKTQAEWKNQPLHMMMKSAVVAALKLAIPDMTGLYIQEEMMDDTPDGEWVPDPDKSNVDNAVEAGRAAKKREAEKRRFRNQGDLRDHDDIEIGETEQKRINAQIKSLGIDRKEIVGRINGVLKVLDLESVKKLSEITHKQAAALIEAWDVELTEIENGMFKEEDSK